MNRKVAELDGALLDEAVAKALGYPGSTYVPHEVCGMWYAGESDGGVKDWTPSTDWAQAGPIIERERIALIPCQMDGAVMWSAIHLGDSSLDAVGGFFDVHIEAPASTPLIAAMRDYAVSKLGAEIDL